jgi:hypothetical protein
MKFYSILLLLSLSLSLWSKENYLSFCSSDKYQSLKKAVADIAIEADKVINRDQENCVDIITKDARVELYETFLEHRFSLYNQAVKKQEDGCHFTLQKTEAAETKGRDFSLGQKNLIQESKTVVTGSEDSSLVILSGEQGFIGVDGTRVYLKCQKINMNSYKVEVSVYNEPAPLEQVQEAKPVAESKQELSTSVEMTKGSSIFLGEILKNLDTKSRTLGYPQGIGLSKNVMEGKVEFNLRLE